MALLKNTQKRKIRRTRKIRKIRKIRKTNKIIKNNNKNKKSLKINKKYKGGATGIEVSSSLFLKCYDENLRKVQLAIQQFSGKHSIDSAIAQEFINEQISDVRRQAARDLIENTIYITLEEVSLIVENLIVKLYNEYDLNSAETIYIYCGKPNKSFYFISILALYYIRKHNFKEPSFFISELTDELFDLIGNKPLIILDDVAYSGSQLSNMLNKIYYSQKIKKQKQAPNLFILLIALNDFSKQKLEQVPEKFSKMSQEYRNFVPSPFKLLFLPDRLYTPLIIKIGIERYFNINMFFSLFTSSQSTPYISLYLDHKIADEASTYKNFLLYGPIVPSNYNCKSFVESSNFDSYSFFPSKNVVTELQKNTLIKNFNEENSTNFNFNINETNSIFTFLIKKLSDQEKEERNIKKDITFINFKPFINNCNKSSTLLDIINNKDVQNCNYLIFMTPKGCIQHDKDECVIEINDEYTMYDNLKNMMEEMIKANIEEGISESEEIITKEKAIEISAKIYSFSCPVTWYKNGEFEMSCLSE